MKHGTPDDSAASLERCFESLRPQAMCVDRSAASLTDPETLRSGALRRYGDLHLETGGKMIFQWHSKYTSQVLPFVMPKMVSGPDYYPDRRWRRCTEDGAALVSVPAFVAGFARRVEASCRTDWSALPIVRSAGYQFVAEHSMALTAPFLAKRNSALNTSAEEYVAAAKNLCHNLHHGFTGRGVHRMPIAGDTTRLPFATGLTPLEKRLAWNQHFLAQHMPGSQQLRQLMGHAQFGARVVYGDCIFFTLSPNEKHSALTLRLSRFRRKDPYTEYGTKAEQLLAGQEYPLLEAAETSEASVEFPEYDLRRAACARDPLAVVEAFRVQILLRLSAVLGVRMCPRCPRCNDSEFGCQDIFGSNMRPVGGVLGGMTAFGGAVEHQNHGTPHFHFEGHVVCAYQYSTLKEVATLIETGRMSGDDVKRFYEWLHQATGVVVTCTPDHYNCVDTSVQGEVPGV